MILSYLKPGIAKIVASLANNWVRYLCKELTYSQPHHLPHHHLVCVSEVWISSFPLSFEVGTVGWVLPDLLVHHSLY